jgi:hypothetical protein
MTANPMTRQTDTSSRTQARREFLAKKSWLVWTGGPTMAHPAEAQLQL